MSWSQIIITNNIVFLSLNIIFVLEIRADPDKIPGPVLAKVPINGFPVYKVLTHLCRIEFPTGINWPSRFLF